MIDEVPAGTEHPKAADLRSDLNQVGQSISKLGADASQYVRGQAQHGRETVRHQYEHLQHQGKHAIDSAQGWYDQGCKYIAKNPAASVLIAVGVGALLSRVLLRD
jgi:ElaB/YqjD/DUF883 family membrane-anchored ribosome-binding protein